MGVYDDTVKIRIDEKGVFRTQGCPISRDEVRAAGVFELELCFACLCKLTDDACALRIVPAAVSEEKLTLLPG